MTVKGLRMALRAAGGPDESENKPWMAWGIAPDGGGSNEAGGVTGSGKAAR